MRIAVVARTTERLGGIETYLEMVLGGLAGRGHSLLLLCEEPADGRQPAIDVPDSVTVVRPTGSQTGFTDALSRWAPEVVFSQGLLAPETERACLAVAPVVFLAHTYHGTCISGRKMFLLPHETPCRRRFGAACLLLYLPRRCGGLSPKTMIGEFLRQSDRLDVARRYAAIATLSDYMRDEYIAHGVDPARVFTLPQWLPLGAAADRVPTDPVAAGSALRLTFIGRLQREKGVKLALDALPLLRRQLSRPVRLTVAGEGPFRAALETGAARLRSADRDIDVRFAGRVNAAERIRLLADTDVVVFPSIWPEPFGLVGLEAAAEGVPVAAFAVGGVPEWLTEGVTGSLAAADPPSAAGLADAIIRCTALPGSRDRIAAETRARVHGGTSAHLTALEQVFCAVIEPARPRPATVA